VTDNKAVEAVGIHVIAPDDLQITQENRAHISSEGFSQCVRAEWQNWRQGTVACKDRSEVSYSTKKPWKQKGTGRARAGSARSPLWRHGGVIFGPQERTKILRVPKKLKRGVFNALFWDYMSNQKVLSIDWVAQESGPKTAHAFKALKQANLADKKIILFVNPYDTVTHASFDNIPNVRMLLFDQPNAYHLANGDCWVFLQKDIQNFKEMVTSWL
jgi:large subunit ribosomal protein L4